MREGELIRIAVEPLSREQADVLLGERVCDRDMRARVFEATGGNPFFLRQVAEAPGVAAADDASARGRDGVPHAVLAAIGEEIASLGEGTREVLRAAAIAGDPFDPGLAAVVAAVPESDLLPEVDELLRRGLVRVGEGPRQLQFRHPIVWRGVYEGAPLGWRLEAHRRLAAGMAALGASPTARAPHLAAAAVPGDREAVAALREAAELSVTRAPASAANWLKAALRLLPEGDEERIPLLVAAATALGSIGQLETSRDLLRDALALIPPDAETARVEAVVALATMEYLLRNLPEATRLLTSTLEGLEDPESEEAVRIMLALSTLGVFDYAQEAVREWGRRAVELATQRGSDSVEAAAAAALAYNEGRVGNVRASQALLDRAAAMVDSLPHPAGRDVAAVFWVSVSEMQVERFEDSMRHGDRARDLARATDQGRWLPQIAVSRAFALVFLGRVPEATDSIEEAIEMARLTANRQFEAIASVCQALICTAAGRPRESLTAGDRACELAGRVAGGDHISTYARQGAAIVYLESGDPAGCRRLMREAMVEPGVDPLWKQQGLLALTEAEIRLGDLAAADRCARMSLDLAERFGLGMRSSWAYQAHAAVQLARGRAASAARTAREAAEAAASATAAIDEGRSRILLGRSLAADGNTESAVAELRRAHDLLDACSAAHYRDAAARELRALGQRVARQGRRPAAPAALSDRERDVAELVAEGLTNREIAATLHLSEKTVEKHLARVFRKFGISRRGAVGPRLAPK